MKPPRRRAGPQRSPRPAAPPPPPHAPKNGSGTRADRVLHLIAGCPHRRATLKQLLRELNVRGGERQALRTLLHELVASRQLIERRHLYEIPAPLPTAQTPAKSATPVPPPRGDLTGRISLHRDGFAFVAPDAPIAGLHSDVFIAPPATGGAMHGDIVAVRLVRQRTAPDGSQRAEGAVVAILRRSQSTVVGIFHRGARGNFVQPIDDRIREPILIPAGAEAPDAKASPHRVLGSSAVDVSTRRSAGMGHQGVPVPARADAGRAAEPRQSTDLEGLAVDVELTSFPSAGAPARGRILEVLGRRDDFGVDVEIIIRKHHLPHRFPPEVLAQAAAYTSAIPAAELARRRDFRHLPIVTIDGESARDFDDAVLVDRKPGGHYQLQVHIADVDHYVPPGSPIDREARLRGTSVYFPDRAVPMLPAELSTDLCSLRPNQDRLVVSCVMDIDPHGEIASYEITPGVIRSAARMTYTQVNAAIPGDPQFELMAELQAILYAKRQKRGSIDFDLPEPEIAFDEFGLMRAIVKSERNVAHRLIEEFMLAAAETVARHLEAAAVPSPYRIHEQPDLKKVAEFEEIAATFGYSLGVGPLPIQKMRVRGRVVEVPQSAKFKISPKNYQRLAAKIAGTPEERMLSFLMLRSLKQARYSARNVGHFALATACYTHFTSPIRRYPDLMLHRILKALLAHQAAPAELADIETLEPICRTSSERERAAADAERELMEWKKVRFMEQRLGEEFDALILHVTRQGFYVELDGLFIEGFIPSGSLDDDDYRYRDASHEWIGERHRRRFRLGGRLRVLVDRIDPVRQQIHFSPATSSAQPRII
ncbi:MAG TPA: ribonuclease R [Terriglobales bacterium]|nr:ribonuclease R [Terriglobales bacterium]